MSTLDARLLKHEDGRLHVFLAGAMDEESTFDQLFARLDGAVVFNLEGVERVNSIGVHRWIAAISKYSGRHEVTIESCSYIVALQASCVANLFGSAVILATEAPYFCPACNENRTVKVSAREISAEDPLPPVKHCDTCSAVMMFDELDNYFEFLVRARH